MIRRRTTPVWTWEERLALAVLLASVCGLVIGIVMMVINGTT